MVLSKQWFLHIFLSYSSVSVLKQQASHCRGWWYASSGHAPWTFKSAFGAELLVDSA